MSDFNIDRRGMLGMGAGIGAGLGLGALSGPAFATPTQATAAALQGPHVDLRTPEGNVLNWVRIIGNADEKSVKHGWYDGKIMAIAPEGPVRPLFRFTGFTSARTIKKENGAWFRFNREIGFYRDIKSGEILTEWKSIYHGETLKVVPVANDPFNRKIEPFALFNPRALKNPDANAPKPPPVPFIQDYRLRQGLVTLIRATHLWYENELTPEKWPRESSGKFVQVSELFTYDMKPEDVQNPKLTSLRMTGTWNRITPWLPWMLMGQSPGTMLYECMSGNTDSIDDLPIDRAIIDYTEKNYPKFMTAPDDEKAPSLSSLEVYARTHTPAPPRPANAPPINLNPS